MTFTGGEPTPCCIASNLDDVAVQRLGQPGSSLVLSTYTPRWQLWTDWRAEASSQGTRALWEIPANTGTVYMAQAYLCDSAGCTASPPQYFDSKVNGTPLPEVAVTHILWGVLVLLALYAMWKTAR